jgi:hypothetical protein
MALPHYGMSNVKKKKKNLLKFNVALKIISNLIIILRAASILKRQKYIYKMNLLFNITLMEDISPQTLLFYILIERGFIYA